jgi:hypothetical protein
LDYVELSIAIFQALEALGIYVVYLAANKKTASDTITEDIQQLKKDVLEIKDEMRQINKGGGDALASVAVIQNGILVRLATIDARLENAFPRIERLEREHDLYVKK